MAKAANGTPFKWRNFFICFMISLGQFCFGYPSSIISLVLVSPGWLAQMGLINAQGEKVGNYEGLIGATNGVYQAGAVINTVITVIVLDRFGRKMSVYYNGLIGIFGGAMAAGSMNIATFIAARFFLGASAWGFLSLTPIYSAELSPAGVRGFFSGMNGFNIAFSYAVAGYFGLGFSYNSNLEVQWRGPLGLYLVFPLLIITTVALFAPESPRWLLMQGRVDEAREVVYNIHRTGKDNFDFAREEFDQMLKQTEIDRTLSTSWFSMFTKKSYRKRISISCFYSFLGQSTAVLVLNNYGPTFYQSLGFGLRKELIYQIGWLTIGYPFCFLGAFLMDRVGRRPLMMTGIGGCCACVIVLAAASAQLESNPTYHQMGALGVSALYCFIAVYSIGVDVGGNVFYAEVFPNHIRTKGVALANVVLALSDLVYLQVTPTAQANIGWKWFLVFIIISGLGVIVLFFTLPETKGVPLEELGKLFGDTDIAVYAGGPGVSDMEKTPAHAEISGDDSDEKH